VYRQTLEKGSFHNLAEMTTRTFLALLRCEYINGL